MSSIPHNNNSIPHKNSISHKNSIPRENSIPRTAKPNTRKRKPEDKDEDPKKHKPAENYSNSSIMSIFHTPEDKGENEDKGEDKDNQPKKKHKPYNGNISSLELEDKDNISSLKLAGDYDPNYRFKKVVNKVINANRFKVRRTPEDNKKLAETFNLEKTLEPKYKERYLEERGFITNFFTGVSNYLKQTISGSTNTSTTSTLSLPLNKEFIHPPLPNGWTETNDDYDSPYFMDKKGNGTYARPYVPLPIPSTVSQKWVSCTILGHGGLMNVDPRLFSPGPMCHVRYFASFANSVLANHANDTFGYQLQIPNTSIAGPTAIRRVNSIEDYDNDYEVLAKYAYNQEKYENRVPINIRRTKRTDAVTCLNKRFSFLEIIDPILKILPLMKKKIKLINEANFGVYIMRNNLGIQEGHKLDITNIYGYPDNVLFQDIAGFITQQLQLNKTDHLYVLDPTCNPLYYLDDNRVTRADSHNFEQLIDYINERHDKNSEIISDKASIFYPSLYHIGGSKRRKQKKTRKNKKM